jgi:GDP-L-fucose synthase
MSSTARQHRSLAGCRVLVTGASGFLGARVCARLAATEAAEVIAPRSSEYDLTEQAAARELIATEQPDVVIHLAAEVGGIGANRDNPGRYFYANMAMGLHLIESARLGGVQKFVQVGTVCAYPKFAPVPFSEDDLWNGYPEETNAPYGIAKKALLVMLQGYREQYGLRSVFLLPTNLYGPGDNFDLETSHVIPALIRRCEEARLAGTDHIICWGTGAVSRDFLYVDDCADAVVLAADALDDPTPVNIGTGSEVTIREIAELIAAATGYAGELRWNPDQPDGQPRRRLDTTRAESLIGFRAETPLADGIRLTLEWFRSSDRPGRALAVS